MASYERSLIGRTRLQIVNSPMDKEALGGDPSIHVVPNGVEIENYDYPESRKWSQDIVLSGSMFYFPNADAAVFFANEIFPMVRDKFPSSRFVIVGARPTREVLRLRRIPGVIVTGGVPNVRPYIENAAVAVSPTRSGGGMQIKILEAMALGTPVVATRKALGGARVEPERHLLVADTAEEFARDVIRLLQDQALARRIRREARSLVEERFTWKRSAGMVAELYEEALRT